MEPTLNSLTLDSIAALATPAGRGGVGIIRVSGPSAKSIAEAVLGFEPKVRFAHYGTFLDEAGDSLDQGIALFFEGPNSFTGEDVLELQGHGGPVVMDMLLQRVLSLGARVANPGEFSERAFLNDKLDLTQAEAIADLIDATSSSAARSALRSLQGRFSERIATLVESLTSLRIFVEAAMDFPEEEVDFLSDGQVLSRLQSLIEQLEAVLKEAKQGALLKEGMHIVLAGKPNAGKSSLLNALVGKESAIVTPIAGTTRDVVREHIHLDGLPLHILDTAGLRDQADQVERIGIERALVEIERCDLVLFVIDTSEPASDPLEGLSEAVVAKLQSHPNITYIRNKIDLTENTANIYSTCECTELCISAKTGAGIELLKTHLKALVGFDSAFEGDFLARRRHLESLNKAHEALLQGQTQLEYQGAAELLAEDLKLAQTALGEITGAVTSDELLGKIFQSFCIGK